MKQEVMKMIKEKKIVAIIRNVDFEDMIPTVSAMYDGGIRLVEVTFNQSGDSSQTTESIKAIKKHFGDKMAVGAGTVITMDQLDLAIDAGAQFIISPNSDIEVIKHTKARGVISIPGALTPTEIVTAYNAGADIVKIFPAGDLGLNYIKALKGPINHIPMVAVGGIDENNIRDFMATGIAGVGIGSNIAKNSLIKQKKFKDIEILAKKYTDQIIKE